MWFKNKRDDRKKCCASLGVRNSTYAVKIECKYKTISYFKFIIILENKDLKSKISVEVMTMVILAVNLKDLNNLLLTMIQFHRKEIIILPETNMLYFWQKVLLEMDVF